MGRGKSFFSLPAPFARLRLCLRDARKHNERVPDKMHDVITVFRLQAKLVTAIFNRPSPYGDRRFIKWTRFFFSASVGLAYEQSAVKHVVRVLKSGTVLYKTHAHISLLNVTFVCSCLLIYSI